MRCFESDRLWVRLQVNLATGEGLEACLEALTAGGKRLVAVINCAALSQVGLACDQAGLPGCQIARLDWVGFGARLPVGWRR